MPGDYMPAYNITTNYSSCSVRSYVIAYCLVSKFKPCDLCAHHIENPQTLFTQCPIVVLFCGDIKIYLEQDSVALMSKPIALYQDKTILVRFK